MLRYKRHRVELSGLGNWAGPKDLFPVIEVDQEKELVRIGVCEVRDFDMGQYGRTHECKISKSPDGSVMRITGMTGLRNDKRHTGGRQDFCYYVFRGDSGHYYTHRAVASKGWITCKPADFLKRLVKMGIGAITGVYQQGDYLLKPAKGHAYPDSDFAHESMGSGHHNWECPVLYASGPYGRQYKVTEPTQITHTAVDGIKHPPITVQPGIYIIGTTSEGLNHSNKRD
jgi:hypothetical protein